MAASSDEESDEMLVAHLSREKAAGR